jgi:hypothetical protein
MIIIFTPQIKVNMKKLFKFYLLSFILLSNFVAYADPGDDDGTGGLDGGDPTYAPINSQLMLLAIVGIAYVIYTYRKNKKIV